MGIPHNWSASGTKLWTESCKAGIAWGDSSLRPGNSNQQPLTQHECQAEKLRTGQASGNIYLTYHQVRFDTRSFCWGVGMHELKLICVHHKNAWFHWHYPFLECLNGFNSVPSNKFNFAKPGIAWGTAPLDQAIHLNHHSSGANAKQVPRKPRVG